MGLSWQQGPLAPGAAGRFLVPGPLPAQLLYARADVDQTALAPAQGPTFCPYKGLCSYYDIAGAPRAAWSYEDAWPDARRVSGLLSFEPDKIEVYLDGTRLRLEPGQTVIRHGVDRDLTTDEVAPGRKP